MIVYCSLTERKTSVICSQRSYCFLIHVLLDLSKINAKFNFNNVYILINQPETIQLDIYFIVS